MTFHLTTMNHPGIVYQLTRENWYTVPVFPMELKPESFFQLSFW